MKRVIFLFFLFSCIKPPSSLATVIFEDDFSEALEDKWEAVRGNIGDWNIVAGKAGTEVTTAFTIYEITPKLDLWNISWGDYIFEVDLFPKKGTDKNLSFRFQDINHWYEIHHSLGVIHLERVYPTQSAHLTSTPYVIQNDSSYHIKIVIRGSSIKVFIEEIGSENEQLIIDYDDIGTPLLTGRIGLKVGTGVVYPSEVWFDNVVVRSLEKTPVVFVPGYMAGWNSVLLKGGQADHWGLNIIAYHHVYKNLINSFFDAGYTEGIDFFIFNYDWRKPLNLLKTDLQQFLDTTVNVPKVNLVGHSFGGLVARAYLQDHSDKVERLVSVGSPHQGELRAYATWEGGEFWQTEPYIKGLGDVLVWRLRQPGESRVETIRRVFPSLQDLLPTFDFLQDPEGSVKNVNTHVWQNTALNSLNSSLTTEEKNLLKTIFGDGFSTLARIIMESIAPETRPWWDWALGLWEDGKPACPPGFGNECPEAKIFSNEGDETILSLSATIDGVVDQGLILTHKDLVKGPAGIEKILELLGISGTPVQEELAVIQKIIFFHLGSPAHLTVTDPEGKKIGWGVLSEIEDALYDEEEKLMMIPNPKDGEYKLMVEGDGEGVFHLLVGQSTEEETSFYEYTGETENGQQHEFRFNFENVEAMEALADPQGLTHLESAKKRLLDLKLQLPTMKQNLIDQLIKNITKIESEIEKGNLERAAGLLERIIDRIYFLRRNFNLEEKEELEKVSIDCQAAYFSINEFKNLKVSKFKAETMLTRASRKLDRLDNQMERRKNEGDLEEAALVFLLGQEYFEKAKEAFGQGEYDKTFIDASIVSYLIPEILRLER